MLYRFGWVNASYVYGLRLLDKRMERALGALSDWETFKKAHAGDYMLEDPPKLSDEADKIVRAANRRVSIMHASATAPNFKADAVPQNGTSAVFDAHNGPNQASEHASG